MRGESALKLLRDLGQHREQRGAVGGAEQFVQPRLVLGGDELLGLVRAFFSAGAPSIVASLWAVDADATRLLMESFYDHLRERYLRDQTIDKAEALRASLAADYG